MYYIMFIRYINTKKIYIAGLFLHLIWLGSCKPAFVKYPAKPLSSESQSYWFDNTAEITSYKLTQARYGELREGTAVMVFVTEPFSVNYFTKADEHQRGNVQVLKMNMTKNFETGIYPYSMMTSTFYPMDGSASSLKLSSSCQEWCGQTYVEMANKGVFHFDIRSYFQGENKKVSVRNGFLEDDIWSCIKLHPDALPQGNLWMVPSMFYTRMLHVETKAYPCTGQLIKGEKQNRYVLHYPDLNRTLEIDFSATFPYEIEAWIERYPDGFGNTKKMLTTEAVKMKSIKTAYWQNNQNFHLPLRDSLGL